MGWCLYEPVGGMLAWLQTCLKADIRVTRYCYSDPNLPAQLVARDRVGLLQSRYPHLLSQEVLCAM